MKNILTFNKGYNMSGYDYEDEYTFDDDETLEYADLTELGDLSEIIESDLRSRVRDLGF